MKKDPLKGSGKQMMAVDIAGRAVLASALLTLNPCTLDPEKDKFPKHIKKRQTQATSETKQNPCNFSKSYAAPQYRRNP